MHAPERLGQQPGQHHWSVAEIFRPGMPLVRVIDHRSYAIGLHTHAFIEVNLVRRGRGWHYLAEGRFAVGPGHVLVIPPGVPHGYVRGRRLDVVHLLLHPQFVQRHLDELRLQPGFAQLFAIEPFFRADTGFRDGLRLDGAERARVLRLCDDLIADWRLEDPARATVIEPLALHLIARLCRCHALQHPAGAVPAADPAAGIHAATAHILAHHDRPLTSQGLARLAGLSPPAFCRLFLRVMGEPPLAYLARVRVEHARRLLADPRPTLTEVALASGFYDAAHLCRNVRRHLGCTPGTIRRGVLASSRPVLT